MSMKLKKLVKTYGWQFLVEVSILCIIGISQLVMLFIPDLGEQPRFEAVFRLIVLVALGHILFRFTSLSPQKLAGIEGVVWDDEAEDAIIDAAKKYQSRRVTVLSSGLSSRHEFLLKLTEAGLETEVFYQNPQQAPDPKDGGRIQERIDALREKFDEDIKGFRKCDFITFTQPASIRCTLLYDSKDEPCFAQIGWYSYTWSPDRVRVLGSQYPSVLVSKQGNDGIRLLQFVAEIARALHNTVTNSSGKGSIQNPS